MQNKKNKLVLVGVLFMVLSFLVISSNAGAESAAEFYKNNKVTIVVPYGPGGGTDYAARLFASFWPEYTDGGVMRVKNMPGGGGVVGSNFMMTAKPDGLTIAVHEQGSGLMVPVLFKDPAVKFDPVKFEYIGDFAAAPSFFLVGTKTKYTKASDLFGASDLRFCATGLKSDNSLDSAIITDIFDMKSPRLIAGYEGTAEMGLAMGRGEINAGQAAGNVVVDWLSKAFCKYPLLTLLAKRSEWMPDVPSVTEITKITPKQEKFLALSSSIASEKPFFAPPETPKDRVEFLRGVFNKMMQDKGFKRLAAQNWKVWSAPLTGEEYAKRIENVIRSSKDIVPELQAKIETMSK